ncbi:carbohydrate-binding module family 13 protein [Leucogyrophana mollusca]|uniref:Carbohydrate-binding module family 13 protein n=1 Tax=Leucogyrophana mollusca TaxID=85980 RepID=A0ACB8BJS1_9AGAM|nr:carbohydrate-binding module family 13 protein [Leucogyrophana mollusca]
MTIQSGHTYKLINVKGGTALDLSGGDNRSIIGYGFHNGPNQEWLFEQHEGGHWTIKSVGSGKYLGLEENPRDGVSVLAVSNPYRWDIWPDDEDLSVYRIFASGTQFNIDLSDHGNPTPGTEIVVWWKWNGRNQCWRVEPIHGRSR